MQVGDGSKLAPAPLRKIALKIVMRLPWGANTGALPLYPASLHIRGQVGVIYASFFDGHIPFVQQVG